MTNVTRPAAGRRANGEGGYIDLGDGRWLYLRYQVLTPGTDGRDEIIQIADDLSIGPNPDLSWLGRGV